MGYNVEKISTNQVKISFAISAEEFEKAVQAVYLKTRGKIAVPGFRKGKAPRKLIEQMYGEGIFFEDALDELFPENYRLALEENKLEVVSQPEMDNIEQMGYGKECKFSVKVYVKPDVELGNYRGLKAVKYIHEVTEEEITARINRDVEKVTTMEDVTDRAVENGDHVVLDYAGSVDGVAFEGGTAQGQKLEIGSGSFIPGFEEQMIGMQIEEERDLHVTFPQEYHAEELAGKEAVFHVVVHAIQVEVKPELNDDFAADVSDYETFDAYRAHIVEELKGIADENAMNAVENNLLQQTMDAADCDIPDSMVQDEIDDMMNDMRSRIASYGIKFDDYIKMTGASEEQLREQFSTDAKDRVKMRLVLEAIVKKEEIQPTEEEIAQEVEDFTKRQNIDTEKFKAEMNEYQKEMITQNLAVRQAIKMIVNSAVVEEKAESERINAQETLKAVQDAAEAITAADEDKE